MREPCINSNSPVLLHYCTQWKLSLKVYNYSFKLHKWQWFCVKYMRLLHQVKGVQIWMCTPVQQYWTTSQCLTMQEYSKCTPVQQYWTTSQMLQVAEVIVVLRYYMGLVYLIKGVQIWTCTALEYCTMQESPQCTLTDASSCTGHSGTALLYETQIPDQRNRSDMLTNST